MKNLIPGNLMDRPLSMAISRLRGKLLTFKKKFRMQNLMPDNLIEGPLEKKINSAIKGKGDHLYAFVRDKDVYLSGEVDHHKTKEEISCLVEKIPGVRMITNHIRIKLPEERRRVEHF